MPKHVAIVMDGNRRWAQARGLTTPEGHEAGAQALKKIVEVDFLMFLIELMIRDNMDFFMRRPASLQGAVREVEEMTRNNSRHHLILATCYSGQWDIVQACRELAAKAQDNQLRPEDIDESMIAGHLATNVLGEFACPDLLIRTSGELRLSNFLFWQSAYTELYFTSTLSNMFRFSVLYVA
nr:unnamed protein product [Digitaria exilis]